jgi:hypothetical protein
MDAYFGYEAIPCYLKKMYAVNLPPVQVAAPLYSPTKLLDAHCTTPFDGSNVKVPFWRMFVL